MSTLSRGATNARPPGSSRDRPSRTWLPFTQMGAFDPAERTFVRGHGTRLVDARGRSTFDAVSSVWTCIHGHCHPRITEAIAAQAAQLDHATALGATNPAAEELAHVLCDATGLDRALFASDGASAIETALKIAVQYWINRGEPQRSRIVRLTSAYHGDTIGAMSVSDIDVFRRNFAGLCFEALPYDAYTRDLERDDIAAVIVEPRVQAAAGMRVVADEAYEALRGPAAPLLIVDEIATGFGRTGSLFAFTDVRLAPDILCVGKGITGGTLALSATLTTEHVYEAFLSEATSDLRHLFHGHSYASNPIACAAALASFELFAEEATLQTVARLSPHLTTLLAAVVRDPHVRGTTQAGLMCGIELDPATLPGDARRSAAWRVADTLYERGHFTRPIGNVVQLVPPLSTTTEELDAFVETLLGALR